MGSPLDRGPVRMRARDVEDLGYTEWPRRARMARGVIFRPNSYKASGVGDGIQIK